jgi:hypothetical protein
MLGKIIIINIYFQSNLAILNVQLISLYFNPTLAWSIIFNNSARPFGSMAFPLIASSRHPYWMGQLRRPGSAISGMDNGGGNADKMVRMKVGGRMCLLLKNGRDK